MCEIVEFTEIANMGVTSEELDRNGWKMMPNGGEYKVVLKSGGVSKRCVSEDND